MYCMCVRKGDTTFDNDCATAFSYTTKVYTIHTYIHIPIMMDASVPVRPRPLRQLMATLPPSVMMSFARRATARSAC